MKTVKNPGMVSDALYYAHPCVSDSTEFDPLTRIGDNKGKTFAAGVLIGLMCGLQAGGLSFREACAEIRRSPKFSGMDKTLFPRAWASELDEHGPITMKSVNLTKIRGILQTLEKFEVVGRDRQAEALYETAELLVNIIRAGESENQREDQRDPEWGGDNE